MDGSAVKLELLDGRVVLLTLEYDEYKDDLGNLILTPKVSGQVIDNGITYPYFFQIQILEDFYKGDGLDMTTGEKLK